MWTKLISKKFNFWRYLLNLWSLLLYALIIIDFYKNNSLDEIIGPIAAIYVGILTLYAGEKEFQRWRKKTTGRHPGEVFVIIWTILIFCLMGAKFAFSKPYVLPQEITSTYIAVLSILVLTRRSKTLHRKGE